MSRWTASAKWGEAPALDGQRDMPLSLRLSEGLGISDRELTVKVHLVENEFSLS